MNATNNLIQALAAGFSDGGAQRWFNYPGFHSNELHDALGGGPISVNEKTAMACAWGSSLGGCRTLVSFKNVGLNDAADAFLGAVLLGCHAGLVVALFEDCDLQHSQNRQDSRFYQQCYGGLWLEPPDLQAAYDLARESFALSERSGAPVVLRLTNALYNRRGKFKPEKHSHGNGQPSVQSQFSRDPSRWVVHPANAADQENRLGARNLTIAEIAGEYSSASFDAAEHPNAGDSAEVVFGCKRDVAASNALRLFTLPLPGRALRKFLSGCAGVNVHENGGDFVAREIAQRLSSAPIVARPMNNRRLRFKHHNSSAHEFLFSKLRKVEGRVVVGDLGEYTMDTRRTVDACLCYGSSVAVGGGLSLAGQKRVFVVTGDGAFAHSGAMAFLEARHRRVSMTVIVLKNGGLRGTGKQEIPCDLSPWNEMASGSLEPGDDLSAIIDQEKIQFGPRLFFLDTSGIEPQFFDPPTGEQHHDNPL